jgi:hypothetical protein
MKRGTHWAAIRGVQARHEYFAVMVPLRSLGAFFAAVEASVPAEQQVLNKATQ